MTGSAGEQSSPSLGSFGPFLWPPLGPVSSIGPEVLSLREVLGTFAAQDTWELFGPPMMLYLQFITGDSMDLGTYMSHHYSSRIL